MDQLLTVSQKFWDAMEHADEAGMRACADANCNFVHIGITCKLDKEIEFYTSGAFQPTDITFPAKRQRCSGILALCSPTVITACCWTERRPPTTLW